MIFFLERTWIQKNRMEEENGNYHNKFIKQILEKRNKTDKGVTG